MARVAAIYWDDDGARVRWAWIDADRVEAQPPATLEEIAARIGDSGFDLIVPARDVRLTRVVMPKKNRRKAMEAIGFLLEDQLAVDMDQCHIVAGAELDEHHVQAAIVAHERMEAWLTAMRAAGLMPRAVWGANLCVPSSAEEGWTGVLMDDEIVMEETAGLGYGLDTGLFAALVGPRLIAADDTRNDAEHGPVLDISDWRRATVDPPVMPPGLDAAGVKLSPQVWPWRIPSGGPNLLTGRYQPERANQRLFRAWLPAMGFAAAIVLALTVGLWMENERMDTELRALQERSEATFRATFPDAQRIVNIRAQTEHRLRGLQSGNGRDGNRFLDLLARLGPVVVSDPAIELRRLTYNEGALDLEVRATSLQTLDDHKEALANVIEGPVEIQSASATEGGVLSRLRVRGAQP